MPPENKQLIEAMKSEIVLTLKAMQPEIEARMETKIKSVVNGKIDDLRTVADANTQTLKDHIKTAEERHNESVEFMTLMAPAADGIRMFATLRKLAVWISGFGIIGTIAWLGVKGLISK